MKNLTNNDSGGNVTYGNHVLLSIVSLATQEISGVGSLVGKGVKMEVVGNTVNVVVSINVYYGVSCADLAFRIQDNIRRNIETSTTYKAGRIDVNILGVEFRDNKNTTTL
ncbi:MAG: Asp23/Gls24 family envelope stress response protein [Clostridia bacterium]|nr:Asp23/Gls24 family envelope stress response protein [Clostridia bacterium]